MRLSWILAGLLCCPGLAAADNIVKDGSFTATTVTDVAKPGTNIGDWTVIGGQVEILNAHGHTFVFFSTGGIEQTLDTVPGQEYDLTASIYGIHGSALVVHAADQETRLPPANNGSDVVRQWTFIAKSKETVLDIYVPETTEISLNSIDIEPGRSPAALARDQLLSVYLSLDHALYYHRYSDWIQQTAPNFTWTAADGTVRQRSDVAADLGRMLPPTAVVQSRVLTVAAATESQFTVQVEVTTTLDSTHMTRARPPIPGGMTTTPGRS